MASTDDGIVRPSESRRPTPEEYEKSGGIKEGSILVLEIIDDSRNCLLGRQTMKVVKATGPSIASQTPLNVQAVKGGEHEQRPLKLKVVKREEFFVDDVDMEDSPDVDKEDGPVIAMGEVVPMKLDPELIFEAAKWSYDVIKDSSHLSTSDNQATAVIKGTGWNEYYGSKDSNYGPVSFKWSDSLFGFETASFKANCIVKHQARPIDKSRIPNGYYLGNVRGECDAAHTIPGMSLTGTCEILDKVNASSDRNVVTPEMTVKFIVTATTWGIENQTVTCNFKVHGKNRTRWLGWNK